MNRFRTFYAKTLKNRLIGSLQRTVKSVVPLNTNVLHVLHNSTENPAMHSSTCLRGKLLVTAGSFNNNTLDSRVERRVELLLYWMNSSPSSEKRHNQADPYLPDW